MHPFFKAIIDAYSTANRPSFHLLSPEQARAQLRATAAAAPKPAGLPDLAEVVNEKVRGPHGDIAIRRYFPADARGTCIYLHSGGWVIGDLDFADTTCRRLAGAIGAEVISVDYRLAPEHPYPQPLDDCWAAVEWAAANRPGPLALIGESAGGNLAAACAIRARDAGGPVLAAQFLAYPVTDHDFGTASYCEVGNRNWLLSTADMRWFWDQYCPPPIDRTDPLVSPLRLTDPAGLPPTLVYVAELDPLRDEGLTFARHLHAAGVPVSTRCDFGMPHGYLVAAGAVPQVAEALDGAAAWLRDQLDVATI